MTNQWGRNNQVTRGGSSGFGIVLPAFLCLALIGSGGYFWYIRQSLQTEISALGSRTQALSAELARVTAEREKAVGDLESFRKNSGNWAGELEKDYANLTLNEIPKLNRLLDKRDADISVLEKRLAVEQKAAESAATGFRETIDGLSQQLSTAKKESADAVQQASDRTRAMEQLAAQASKLTTEAASLRSALERAQADTVSARKALESRTAEQEKKPPTFKSALDLARDSQIQALERSLSEERRKTAALEKELARRPASADPVDGETSGEAKAKVPQNTVETSNAAVKPRDSALVETIVSGTRGLGLLDEASTERLKDELVAGACVTDALETVFDKVPLVLMRNLMRDFKSDC
ncbi:hypothetical protein [Pararhizobium gei]|uniref:hypothetical protein n=1 Tax=Pararhizobium gei TaxID=1395951 RepID=UPI0023D9BF8E|nr:hypothetical protein [Rhizobium gei]